MTGPCNCRHCAAPATEETPAAPEPIALPDQPTPIRVHTPGADPFDCTLHPDGTLTADFNGEQRRNFMTFADMCERNWAHSRIEFNLEPLPEEPEPEPVVEAVQDALL